MSWALAIDADLTGAAWTPRAFATRALARPDTLHALNQGGCRGTVASEPTAEIIDQARSGDPDAFATLFRAHGDEVLRVCQRMLGSSDAASDAQSEVFLKTRRALAGYDGGRSFRSWLLTIASNHCIDQLRRTARERRLFVDPGVDPGDLRGPAPSPLSRLLAREKRGELDLAIERLPLQYRLPLLLRYHSEASYDEIAESLGTTRAQVGTLLFRAKRKLREQMTGSAVAGGAPSTEGQEPEA